MQTETRYKSVTMTLLLDSQCSHLDSILSACVWDFMHSSSSLIFFSGSSSPLKLNEATNKKKEQEGEKKKRACDVCSQRGGRTLLFSVQYIWGMPEASLPLYKVL